MEVEVYFYLSTNFIDYAKVLVDFDVLSLGLEVRL